MNIPETLSRERYSFVELCGIAIATRSLFNEHWVFGWSVLVITLLLNLSLKRVSS